MSECLCLGLSLITQQRSHVSGLGAPSRPAIAQRGSDRLDIQSRKYAPSNGVYRGGLARRLCHFCGLLPHTVGFSSSQR